MELDIFSIIVGSVCLGAFIVPIALLHSGQRRKSKQFIEQYLALAEKHNLNISDKDGWNGQYAIGVDRLALKLLYINTADDTSKELLIDLKEIRKCDILNKNRVVNGSKSFERLALIFKFSNATKNDVIVDFHFSNGTLALNDELQILNKWHTIISELLTDRK